MSVQAQLVKVAEFLRLQLPREGHYELHHGEVILISPPKWEHQEIQDRIQVLFKALARGSGIARMEMAFRPAPEYEVWVADVGFVRSERARAVGPDDYLAGAPDLVVEVLSPSNTAEE